MLLAAKVTVHVAAHADVLLPSRCPVCRAAIPGWDGKGRGVIGLKPRVVYNIDNGR